MALSFEQKKEEVVVVATWLFPIRGDDERLFKLHQERLARTTQATHVSLWYDPANIRHYFRFRFADADGAAAAREQEICKLMVKAGFGREIYKEDNVLDSVIQLANDVQLSRDVQSLIE